MDTSGERQPLLGRSHRSKEYVTPHGDNTEVCMKRDTDSRPTKGCCTCSTKLLLYCSHALSAWGDRMWQFAVGIFLVTLSPGSLQLTATYGFASGGAILLFGALVGDWVDRTARLKAARDAIVFQNLSVCLSAAIISALALYPEVISAVWGGWLTSLLEGLIILFAVLADLGTVARQISIERDWIVVICEDEQTLTEMSAFLRRIDLTTNILAPIATGQVITYGSMFIGAVVLAAWNLVFLFVEFGILYQVYKSVPELANKVAQVKHPERQDKKDEDRREQTKNESQSLMAENPFGSRSPSSTEADIVHADPTADTKNRNLCLVLLDSFVTLVRGWRTYMSQPIMLAGLGLAGLYMTVLGFDNVTTGYVLEQGVSESILGILMAAGAVVGIIGTVLYPVLRRRIGLRWTGLLAVSVQVICLSLCVVSVFAPGSAFDPGYLFAGSDVTTDPSGDVGNLSSVFHGGYVSVSALDILSDDHDVIMRAPYPEAGRQIQAHGRVASVAAWNTTAWPQESTTAASTLPSSYISIILLMTGIVTSRIGLWMADLTVTQLLLETPAEHERGIVNGVQSSLNKLSDIIKYGLVILLPWPQTFGILVIVSFIFMVLSGVLYAAYAAKAGRLDNPNRNQSREKPEVDKFGTSEKNVHEYSGSPSEIIS